MKYLILFSLFIAISVEAKDNKMSKDEFLSALDSGTISMDRAKLFNVPKPVLDKIQLEYKKKYPLFQSNMMYVNFIQTTNWIYTIFYDWTGDKCVYRVEEIDQKLGKPNEKTLDPTGTEIAMRYCIKLYKIGN